MSYALHHYGIPSNGTIVKPLKGANASHRIGRHLMQLGDVLDDLTLDVETAASRSTASRSTRAVRPGLALLRRARAQTVHGASYVDGRRGRGAVAVVASAKVRSTFAVTVVVPRHGCAPLWRTRAPPIVGRPRARSSNSWA